MSNEERLRKAVESIADNMPASSHPEAMRHWIEEARSIAQEALDATAVSDMDRLVEWLEEQIRRKRLSRRRYVHALIAVRDHIDEMQRESGEEREDG